MVNFTSRPRVCNAWVLPLSLMAWGGHLAFPTSTQKWCPEEVMSRPGEAGSTAQACGAGPPPWALPPKCAQPSHLAPSPAQAPGHITPQQPLTGVCLRQDPCPLKRKQGVLSEFISLNLWVQLAMTGLGTTATSQGQEERSCGVRSACCRWRAEQGGSRAGPRLPHAQLHLQLCLMCPELLSGLLGHTSHPGHACPPCHYSHLQHLIK